MREQATSLLGRSLLSMKILRCLVLETGSIGTGAREGRSPENQVGGKWQF